MKKLDATQEPIRIAVVGVGKIALDKHLPTIRESSDFELVGVVNPAEVNVGAPWFPSIDAAVNGTRGLGAVTLCVPPRARASLARSAIDAALHVMLEKPPGSTVNECEELVESAAAKKVALFTAWHSREAAAVRRAREWLSARKIKFVRIEWKENVRVWHPGQAWIWQAGGFGVFDPGINALSILTTLLPGRIRVDEAILYVPKNADTPIAAEVTMLYRDIVPIRAEFDFRERRGEIWAFEIATDSGTLRLSCGGAQLSVDDRELLAAPDREYPALYGRFAQLIRSRTIGVDLEPMRLVADCWLVARRVAVEPLEPSEAFA